MFKVLACMGALGLALAVSTPQTVMTCKSSDAACADEQDDNFQMMQTSSSIVSAVSKHDTASTAKIISWKSTLKEVEKEIADGDANSLKELKKMRDALASISEKHAGDKKSKESDNSASIAAKIKEVNAEIGALKARKKKVDDLATEKLKALQARIEQAEKEERAMLKKMRAVLKLATEIVETLTDTDTDTDKDADTDTEGNQLLLKQDATKRQTQSFRSKIIVWSSRVEEAREKLAEKKKAWKKAVDDLQALIDKAKNAAAEEMAKLKQQLTDKIDEQTKKIEAEREASKEYEADKEAETEAEAAQTEKVLKDLKDKVKPVLSDFIKDLKEELGEDA